MEGIPLSYRWLGQAIKKMLMGKGWCVSIFCGWTTSSDCSIDSVSTIREEPWMLNIFVIQNLTQDFNYSLKEKWMD